MVSFTTHRHGNRPCESDRDQDGTEVGDQIDDDGFETIRYPDHDGLSEGRRARSDMVLVVANV